MQRLYFGGTFNDYICGSGVYYCEYVDCIMASLSKGYSDFRTIERSRRICPAVFFVADINVIFLISFEQVIAAAYGFPDYFEFNSEIGTIGIVKGKDVEDLENRFIGYLPIKVLCFLVESLKEFVEKNKLLKI